MRVWPHEERLLPWKQWVTRVEGDHELDSVDGGEMRLEFCPDDKALVEW